MSIKENRHIGSCWRPSSKWQRPQKFFVTIVRKILDPFTDTYLAKDTCTKDNYTFTQEESLYTLITSSKY